MLDVLAIAFPIVAVAAFAQTVTGFGFALLAVPLLAMLTDPPTAVVAVTVLCLVMNVVVIAAERAHIRWRYAVLLTLASVPGMPLGLFLLKTLSAPVLTGLIAIVTLASTALVWRGWRMSTSTLNVAGAGALSGTLLTATGTNGPPLVAALQAWELAPREFRATIATIFAGSGLVGIGGFALTGVVTGQVMAIVGIGLAATAIGGWLGNKVFHRTSPERFRRVLLGALVLTSVIALARAVPL